MEEKLVYFGTFNFLDARRFYDELLRSGVSAKLIIPGTNLSPDFYGNSSSGFELAGAMDILVSNAALDKAEEVRRQLRVERMENIPDWRKRFPWTGRILAVFAALFLLFYLMSILSPLL